MQSWLLNQVPIHNRASTIQDFWASIDTDISAYNDRYTQNIYINIFFYIKKYIYTDVIQGIIWNVGKEACYCFFLYYVVYVAYHYIEFWTSATLAGTLFISFDLVYLAYMNLSSFCFRYQLYIYV